MKCSFAALEAAGFKGVRHAPCRWGRAYGRMPGGESRSLPDGAETHLSCLTPLSGWIGYVQAPFGRRGCNGERAAGAPCQDERLAKPEPQAQDFVIQTHILRNVLTLKNRH